MSEKLKIIPPEGYEIDTEKSTFEEIVFRKSVERFPKSWEGCVRLMSDRNPYGYFIHQDSSIVPFSLCPSEQNKNSIPTSDLAKAILALEQLLLIRHVYNRFEELGFRQNLYVIYIKCENGNPNIRIIKSGNCHYTLSFKDELTAQTFKDNFYDLILQAALIL